MNIRNENGAITIYLTIIFLVVLALVGALVDGGRIRVGEVQVSRASEGAIMSTLSGYYNPLKEDYGLFALGHTDEKVLKNEIEYYLNKNLMTELGNGSKANNEKLYGYLKGIIIKDEYKDVDFIDLFQYRLDNVEVERVHNLTENIVMRNQIIEFMKYRAPIELIKYIEGNNFLDKLKEVQNIANTSKIVNKKLEFDELVGELGLLQNKLLELTDDYLGRTFEPIYRRISDYEGNALDYIGELDNYYEDEENNYIPDPYYVNRSFDLLIETIEDSKKTNRDIINTAVEIENLLVKIDKAIDGNKKFIDSNRENLVKDFLDNFKKEIKELENILEVEGNQSEKIKKIAEENNTILDGAIRGFNGINNSIDNISMNELIDDLIDIEDDLSDDYNDIIYSIKTVKKQDDLSSLDNRDQVNIELKKMKDEDLDNATRYNNIDGEQKKKLPSFKDKDGNYPNKVITDTSLLDNHRDELSDIDTSKDYTVGKSKRYRKGDMDSTKNIVGNASIFGGFVVDSLTELRDELYINEYIMGMFTNAVPKLIRSDIANPASTTIVRDTTKDLQNKDKVNDRGAFFENGEVEYIIFGRDKEKDNILAMKSSLFAIRTTANLIAIYTIPSKVSTAESIAISVAAALATTSLGSSTALIPVIKNSILAGWAMTESIADVKYLMDGRSIPAVKDQYTWITGWDSPNALTKGEDNPLAMSYHDYLRVFLMIKPKDSTMNNLQDLIQLNLAKKVQSDFMLKDYYTYIGLKTDVSMRYLFMTQTFMPKSKATEDGKHRIRSIIYQGY